MNWQTLHALLQTIFAAMSAKSSSLIAGGQAIGGAGAVIYIASRIWRNMANNEPIDFYPLFRPFALAFVLGIYTSFIGPGSGIDTLLQPTIDVSGNMLANSNNATADYVAAKQKAVDAALDAQNKGYLYDDAKYDALLDSYGITDVGSYIGTVSEKMKYQMKQSFSDILFNILDFLFQAASLCIDFVRTFFLSILLMVGPISIGISVWDGFKDTIQFWLAKYIQVFLWLPVANILGTMNGTVQQLMMKSAIDQMTANPATALDMFSGGDIAYMIFLLMGIIGYTQVPSIAGMILHSCGVGGAMSGVNKMASRGANLGGAAAGAALGAGARGGMAAGGRAAQGARNIGEMVGGAIKGTGVYKKAAGSISTRVASAKDIMSPSSLGRRYGENKYKS